MKFLFPQLLLVLLSLVFSNSIVAQSEDLEAEKRFSQQKKNIIKFNILSATISEHLDISYETAINERQSLELKLGIIGIGLITHETITAFDGTSEKEYPAVSSGMFFAAGYKFFISDFPSAKSKRKAHILKGLYLQPELIAGFYSRKKLRRLQIENGKGFYKQKVNYQAIIINCGFQGIINKKLVIDYFIGVGVGNDNIPEPDSRWLYFGEFHRGIYKPDPQVSLALKMGLKVGLLF